MLSFSSIRLQALALHRDSQSEETRQLAKLVADLCHECLQFEQSVRKAAEDSARALREAQDR